MLKLSCIKDIRNRPESLLELQISWRFYFSTFQKNNVCLASLNKIWCCFLKKKKLQQFQNKAVRQAFHFLRYHGPYHPTMERNGERWQSGSSGLYVLYGPTTLYQTLEKRNGKRSYCGSTASEHDALFPGAPSCNEISV